MNQVAKQDIETNLKSLFEYSDYRAFLNDYYHHAKKTKRNFSFRLLAKLCGFQSSNFLMLVMTGRSSLTPKSVEKVIQGLKLNKEEADFFRNLVAHNEAKSTESQNNHALEMMRARTFKKIYPLSEAQYRYLGTWYLPVIRSVVGLKNFTNDVTWIAEKMCPALKISQVKDALKELLEIGLLREKEDGTLSQTEKMVSTPPVLTSAFATQYHRNMIEKALESVYRFRRDERHLTGSTVALDKEGVQKVKAMIEKFQNDVMGVAAQCSSAEDIYQVNFQIFPLFKSSSESEKK